METKIDLKGMRRRAEEAASAAAVPPPKDLTPSNALYAAKRFHGRCGPLAADVLALCAEVKRLRAERDALAIDNVRLAAQW